MRLNRAAESMESHRLLPLRDYRVVRVGFDRAEKEARVAIAEAERRAADCGEDRQRAARSGRVRHRVGARRCSTPPAGRPTCAARLARARLLYDEARHALRRRRLSVRARSRRARRGAGRRRDQARHRDDGALRRRRRSRALAALDRRDHQVVEADRRARDRGEQGRSSAHALRERPRGAHLPRRHRPQQHDRQVALRRSRHARGSLQGDLQAQRRSDRLLQGVDARLSEPGGSQALRRAAPQGPDPERRRAREPDRDPRRGRPRQGLDARLRRGVERPHGPALRAGASGHSGYYRRRPRRRWSVLEDLVRDYADREDASDDTALD